jgi:hypothetical protein
VGGWVSNSDYSFTDYLLITSRHPDLALGYTSWVTRQRMQHFIENATLTYGGLHASIAARAGGVQYHTWCDRDPLVGELNASS